MNKYVRFANEIRVNSLLSGGVAILLSACGGSVPEPEAVQAPQVAAMTYNGTLAPADLYVSPSGADTNA
ncbi:hypothetical protein LP420_03225 [Massilia sp. B-10]|nr:hypothetical protein LP420_03225 [Massilia sp. B-10]